MSVHLFNMRYEIDVDMLLKASVIAAEGRLYQQKWYLSCEISLFFRSISNLCVLYRDYPENTHSLSFIILPCCSKLMITSYNTGARWYCFQLLIGIFSSDYQKIDTENTALWQEENQVFLSALILHYFQSHIAHLIQFFSGMSTCQVLTASTTSQPSTFHRSIHNP